MNHEQVMEVAGRTPRGVRGLKFSVRQVVHCFKHCRTPRGVRGLKYDEGVGQERAAGRTPRGVRGLKWRGSRARVRCPLVAPLAGCVD